ncbi:hypothetical protein [Thaumasiovibrio subtropicus]|uniref:hypothetical protein n=2 Tax=Thaumasiovibrio subtropicus TaxID=1891207 RepID=UPI001C85159F|nr:hypothetical protein [Thaumasiovibrio subtropicus]
MYNWEESFQIDGDFLIESGEEMRRYADLLEKELENENISEIEKLKLPQDIQSLRETAQFFDEQFRDLIERHKQENHYENYLQDLERNIETLEKRRQEYQQRFSLVEFVKHDAQGNLLPAMDWNLEDIEPLPPYTPMVTRTADTHPEEDGAYQTTDIVEPTPYNYSNATFRYADNHEVIKDRFFIATEVYKTDDGEEYRESEVKMVYVDMNGKAVHIKTYGHINDSGGFTYHLNWRRDRSPYSSYFGRRNVNENISTSQLKFYDSPKGGIFLYPLDEENFTTVNLDKLSEISAPAGFSGVASLMDNKVVYPIRDEDPKIKIYIYTVRYRNGSIVLIRR